MRACERAARRGHLARRKPGEEVEDEGSDIHFLDFLWPAAEPLA